MTNQFRTTYLALTQAAKAATKAYNAVPHTDALEQAMLAAYDAVGALLEANGLAYSQTGKRFHLKGEARV
jgi:hypothetical protein